MRPINFDHLACSPILPEVKEAMLPFLSGDIGNPLSKHIFGDKPRTALQQARNFTAELINADPEEIIFTSCGSESNNLTIKGAVLAQAKKGRHIIASPIEHHSVHHPLKYLEKNGYQISWLDVDSKGFVNPNQIRDLIKEDTVLITVIFASSEIGMIEPIREIAKIARERGIVFYSDAIACVGVIPIDVKELDIDILSFSANTFYGPQGAAGLYLRKGVRIFPLIEGGIQEGGLRAGTHNIAAIAGMGQAAKIAKEKLLERKEYLLNLRDKLIDGVVKNIPDCFLTGDRIDRLPNHASFCVKFIEGESMLLHLNFKGFAGTSGSTCSSEALKVSRVLKAIGVDAVSAQGSVVFCLGIDNTQEDIELFLKEFPAVVEKLRQMSPLYDKI